MENKPGQEVEDIIAFTDGPTPENYASFFVKFKNGYSKTYELPDDLITYIKQWQKSPQE